MKRHQGLVFIKQIPIRGLELHEEFDAEWLLKACQRQETDLYQPVGGATFRGTATKEGGETVRIQGHLDFKVRYICHYCQDPLELDVAAEVDRVYLPAKNVNPEKELDFFSRGECSYYRHDCVELTPELSEEILLSLPMFPPFEQDEAGRCVWCGKTMHEALALTAPEGEKTEQNQKEKKISADAPKPPDPRWARLKNIKLD